MRHDADDVGYSPESCRNMDNESYYIPSMTIFIGAFAFFYIISIICWMRKRNHFPIKERSPYLILITMIILLLQSLLNPIYYDVYSLFESPDNKGSGEENINSVQELVIILTLCLRLVIYWPIMIRTARIIYVFNFKHPRKVFDYIFQREQILVGITGVIFIIIFLICYFPSRCFSMETGPDDDDSCENGVEFVWVIYLLITITLFIFLTYYSRDIHKEYNFQTEMIIMCTLEGIYNQVFSLVVIFWPEYMSFCVFTGPFSLMLIVENLRGITLSLIVVWMPLKLTSKKLIPLAPSIACERVEFFLADERLFGVFYKYLEYLKKRWPANPVAEDRSCCSGQNDSLLASKLMMANSLDYLRFKYDLFIAEKEPDRRKKNCMYMEIFKNYISGAQSIFPDRLLQKIDRNTRISSEKTTEIDFNMLKFSFSDFEDFLEVADEVINHIFFTHFKKTFSFLRINKLMAKNDLINSRIIQFRLTSF